MKEKNPTKSMNSRRSKIMGSQTVEPVAGSSKITRGSSRRIVVEPEGENSRNVSHRTKARASQKSNIKAWTDDFEVTGFTKCNNNSCNFIALSLSSIQEHHKTCKGVPCFDMHFCSVCKNYLGTEKEFNYHSAVCTGECVDNSLKLVNQLQKNVASAKKELSSSSCGVEEHATFGQKHIRENAVRSFIDEGDGCIIQPRPDLSHGQSNRRRSYNKQHKNTWVSTLEKLKYVKCTYQDCQFIAMSLEDMVSHVGYCNGDGSFAQFECPHCKGRVMNKEILSKHIERSHGSAFVANGERNENAINSQKKIKIDCSDSQINSGVKVAENSDKTSRHQNSNCRAKVTNSTASMEHNRKRKTPADVAEHSKSVSSSLNEQVDSRKNKKPREDVKYESVVDGVKVAKKRGRKPKDQTEQECQVVEVRKKAAGNLVQCGKCDFTGTREAFNDHNLKKHVNLSWVEGEKPVDLTDEKEVIRLVKMAFKLTKKATCEICQDVKRSFLGFATHVQSCGKSEEEKDALKVQCPFCPARCLKYSMPVHIKLSHSNNTAAEDEKFWEMKDSEKGDSVIPSGKRKSALKAASRLQDVLPDIEEPESCYVWYRKEIDDKFPKVPCKLNNIWYKLKRENKQIECRHSGCKHVSGEVKEARRHHFTCPALPDSVYMCESCDFYTADEPEIKTHVTIHKSTKTKKKTGTDLDFSNGGGENGEEDNMDEDNVSDTEEDNDDDDEEEEDSGEENEPAPGDDDVPKKWKKKSKEKTRAEMDYDLALKRNFCMRENIENNKRFPYFCSSLKMTVQEEWNEEEKAKSWTEFHTKVSDWRHVQVPPHSDLLPPLKESISVNAESPVKNGERKWRRLKRFEGDLFEGTPTMFTGGSVRCLSWCKISFHRTVEKSLRQYLALVTAMDLNVLKNLHERSESSSKGSLIQIWDCGILESKTPEHVPKFCLGIFNKSEVWDLSWFPEDTSAGGTKDRLPRIGLLATASEDAVVRVWSICDPNDLEVKNGLPIYETSPVGKLITDDDLKDKCLRLAVGQDGILAGGYGNGIVALWNLKNANSPFSEKEGKCFVIRSHLTIQAHRAAITALTFCPSHSRYLSSAAMDRLIKVWDLESPTHPIDLQYKELCLNSIWAKNWPLLFYNFDDFPTNKNRGVGKFIRDILFDRPLACLVSDDMCLSLCFSDWLNILCGSNSAGDIQLRYFRNFISDQKKDKAISLLSFCRMEKLQHPTEAKATVKSKGDHKSGQKEDKAPLTYQQFASDYGLVFRDSCPAEDKTKSRAKVKKEIRPEEFPIRAINVVSFNPNFKSFIHLAAGYSNGLVRIPCLREVQANENLKVFLSKAVSKSF